MSNKPISDLRRRMIADMTVRSFSDKTQHDYIRHIEAFARFLGRSPDTATGDDIRRFQFTQVEQGAQPPKMNTQASALRFFLTITLGRADLAHQLARTHYPRKLPRMLTADQVARLLEAAPGPGLSTRPRSASPTAPVCAVPRWSCCASAISIQRMLIRVEMGKGRKDRHALLSPQLLELLRAWWRQCRSRGWLFPGRDPLLPMTTRNSIAPATWRPKPPARQLGHAAYAAALVRHASPGERHRRARDPGVAGARKLDTTARYTHVATNVLRTVMSPLERLTLPKEEPSA